MMNKTFAITLVFITFLTLAILLAPKQPEDAPATIDMRYVEQLPIVELRIPVQDVQRNNNVSGEINIYNTKGHAFIDSFPVRNNVGTYLNKLVLSNKPYDYEFVGEGYYPGLTTQAARIPLKYVGDNISLNATLEPISVYKEGRVELWAVWNEGTIELVNISEQITIDISKSAYEQYRIRMRVTPFINEPFLILEDGGRYDMADLTQGMPRIRVMCDGNQEFYTDSIYTYKFKLAPFTKEERFDCEITIDTGFVPRLEGDFVFYIADKTGKDETDWNYYRPINISQVLKFQFVSARGSV